MGTRVSPLRAVFAATGIAVLGVTGVATGAAFADNIPAVPSPQGLVTADGTSTTPMPAPKYAANASGLTYGSAMKATSPKDEPDLVLVVASNGRQGYVLKTDLHKAEGTGFKTPEEALAWQASLQGRAQSIAVYESDGKTVIGDFVIEASNGNAVSQ